MTSRTRSKTTTRKTTTLLEEVEEEEDDVSGIIDPDIAKDEP